MSDDTLNELDIPDGVRTAEQAVEVFRAWVADGALHVVFDPETFRHDAGEWGRLLADSAHHIADAVAMDGQMSRAEALKAIRGGFECAFAEEANTPATARSGKIKRSSHH